MLEALAIGITGFVGSQFNVAADLYNEILQRFRAEGVSRANVDALRALQNRGHDLIDAWQTAAPGYNGFKFFATLAGLDVGEARLPNLPIDSAQSAVLKQAFDGFCANNKKMKMCSKVWKE